MKKVFFYQDKSGRGFTSNLPKTHILKTWTNDKDWDGVKVKDYVRTAEVGDVWENASDKLTRTK